MASFLSGNVNDSNGMGLEVNHSGSVAIVMELTAL